MKSGFTSAYLIYSCVCVCVCVCVCARVRAHREKYFFRFNKFS